MDQMITHSLYGVLGLQPGATDVDVSLSVRAVPDRNASLSTQPFSQGWPFNALLRTCRFEEHTENC